MKGVGVEREGMVGCGWALCGTTQLVVSDYSTVECRLFNTSRARQAEGCRVERVLHVNEEKCEGRRAGWRWEGGPSDRRWGAGLRRARAVSARERKITDPG